MVKLFNPTCPKCKGVFHVHHEDLRHSQVKLLCPYCGERFLVEESFALVEHDGTLRKPAGEDRSKLST